MKVYISQYRNHWLSPYTILEKVLFWKKFDHTHYDLPWVVKVTDFLSPFCEALQKVLDFFHPRIKHVKIDNHDTWNMDSTLAHIILPMLKQLRDTKHGSPIVDLEDVPENLRGTGYELYVAQETFDFYHEGEKDVRYEIMHDRWTWVLNEMIFAFERICDTSWEDNFISGEIDMKHVPVYKDGNIVSYELEPGPNHTYYCDYEAIGLVNERISNGCRLFGKYYRDLWD